MTVLWVIFIIAGIAAFWFFSLKLNAYSESIYQYAPINIGTIAFGFLPFIILVAGQYGEHNGESGSLQIAIFAVLILFAALTWWIAKKTSLGLAIVASAMIMLISLAFLAIVLFFAMLKEASRDKDYYH